MEKRRNPETFGPATVARDIERITNERGDSTSGGPRELKVTNGTQSLTAYFRGELPSPGSENLGVANVVGDDPDNPGVLMNILVKVSGVEVRRDNSDALVVLEEQDWVNVARILGSWPTVAEQQRAA